MEVFIRANSIDLAALCVSEEQVGGAMRTIF